ncbi:MAG: endo-1,4-beta-xylanase [Candidatus Nanopelagicales bacterium]
MKRALLAVLTAALLVPAVPATAAVGPVAPPPKAGWVKVDPSLFGMHVAQISETDFPGKLGGVRIWDNGVRWDQVEKQQGQYDWDRLDRIVANAKKAGAKEIMYVLGSTPEWAAKEINPDDFYYGGGTASDVKTLSLWRDWVRAVATRYQGQITSYQIWNEANLASFWAPTDSGNWKRMARLTEIAADEIRAIDPAAKIASASSTVIQAKKFSTQSFFYRYLRSVKKRKIKLDAISVHLYPWTTKGPGGGTSDRAAQGPGTGTAGDGCGGSVEGAAVGHRGELRQPARQQPPARGVRSESRSGLPGADLRRQRPVRRDQGVLVRLGQPRHGHQHQPTRTPGRSSLRARPSSPSRTGCPGRSGVAAPISGSRCVRSNGPASGSTCCTRGWARPAP